MNRDEKVLSHINRNGFGLEIGPSFNPIAPKKAGYKVHILDHMNREQLISKYRDHNVSLENIEEVDFVWTGGNYSDLIGQKKYYDWIIASHLIEHTPDLIGFLNNCDDVLKDDGVLSLVVPDKRFCFDHYRPITGISKIIDSYFQKDKTHTPGAAAEFYLYFTTKGGQIAWSAETVGQYNFLHTIDDAIQGIDLALNTDTYQDLHAWCFVPNSFRLMIHDLFQLGYIHLQEVDFFPTEGCEFYITLSRAGKGINKSRLEMLDIIEFEIMSGLNTFPGLIGQNQRLTALLAEKENMLVEKDRNLSGIYSSTSWRITQPLRKIRDITRGTWLEQLLFSVRNKR